VGQQAAMVELRKLLSDAATPEEQAAVRDAPLESHREVFGLTIPDERVLPRVYQEQYEREFSGHEQDFLLAARENGLDSRLVGELRDAGIRMAIEADGKPVSDQAWAKLGKRFAGRLTANQFKSLRTWCRNSVERGGAS
jgi:hypothetical protein